MALPEGKGVNEAFVMRFDPGPAPELDLINCDDRQTAGAAVRMRCTPPKVEGARQLISFRWTQDSTLTCPDATCPATATVKTTAGRTFSCVREAANGLDCGWDF